MSIEEVFLKFQNEIAEIYLHKSAIRKSSELALVLFNKKNDAINACTNLAQYADDGENIFFKSVITGQVELMKQTSVNLEEQRKNISVRKNRQYQWILVEAQESFERFIGSCYKFLLSEGKLIMPSKKRDEDKFEKQLAAILNGFPVDSFFKSTLDREELNIYCRLVEQLRHQIVHANGIVRDKNRIYEKVSKESWNNGSPPSVITKIIDKYLIFEHDFWRVTLLENDATFVGICIYSDQLEGLIEKLIAMAELIKVAIVRHEKCLEAM